MFPTKLLYILTLLAVTPSLLPASNEPQEVVWSPLLELTNHTQVLSIDYTREGEAHVQTRAQTLRFFEGLRRLEIEEALYWMNGPLVYLDREWQVPQVDLEHTLAPLVSHQQPAPQRAPFVVVLDPGHGGHDPGAVEGNLHEKDLVLDVARIVQSKLEAEGVTVRLTRTNDTFITLEDRPLLARKLDASILVSIHANRTSSSYARGIESFILPAPGFPGTSNSPPPRNQSLTANRFDLPNLLLANALHRSMVQRTGAVDRGIKRERFAVLRDAPCPAVLLEIGFMSNPEELANLRSPAWIDTLTDAIRDGILAYRPQPLPTP